MAGARSGPRHAGKEVHDRFLLPGLLFEVCPKATEAIISPASIAPDSIYSEGSL